MLFPPPRTGFFATDGEDEGDEADSVKSDFSGFEGSMRVVGIRDTTAATWSSR
jgi:hypothetical protein